uniref:Uncharacterized protein n=1 Tax=Cherry twisted leaf associated virus TaxID=1424279 RepID=W6JF55_9VIRU|nr:hypothetical protein [Cherry twisted leaf associated virus]
MSLRLMRMGPSSSTVQEIRSRRRQRRGRPISIEEQRASLRKRVIWRCSEQGEEGPHLIQKIPLQALIKNLSARLRRLTPLHSTLPLMTPSRPSQQTGLNTSKSLRVKRSLAFLILCGTATTTVQVTRPNLLAGQAATLNWRIWQALLGATVLYVAFAQNMRQ